jgi:DNA-binding ferritin-like protein
MHILAVYYIMPKPGTRRQRSTKSNKTRSTTKTENKSHIVRMFMEMLNVVKLYHWKTHSFAQHKATEELYEQLNENVDKFVEVLLGKDGSRINMTKKRVDLIDPESINSFKSRIYEYRAFLVDLNRYFSPKRDTDLLNIRDEILGDINQFLYLLTFDK